jgi:hypothetical protein
MYGRRKKEEERKAKASGKKEVEKIRWVPPFAWGERAPDSGSVVCVYLGKKFYYSIG